MRARGAEVARRDPAGGLPGMLALIFTATFAAALGLDYATARYQVSLRAARPHAAARWSVAMCLLSTIALLALVDVSRWCLVPELAGLYAGTWLGARNS